MLSNENGMVLDLSEVNQVVPGLFLDDLLNSPPPTVHSPFLHYKGKQEEPYDDTGFFTIPEARSYHKTVEYNLTYFKFIMSYIWSSS